MVKQNKTSGILIKTHDAKCSYKVSTRDFKKNKVPRFFSFKTRV